MSRDVRMPWFGAAVWLRTVLVVVCASVIIPLGSACRTLDRPDGTHLQVSDLSGGIGLTRFEAGETLAHRPSLAATSSTGESHRVSMEYVWVPEVRDDVVRYLTIKLASTVSLDDARSVARAYMPDDSVLLSRTAPVEAVRRDGTDYFLSETLANRLKRSGNLAGTRMIVVYGSSSGGVGEIRIGAHP